MRPTLVALAALVLAPLSLLPGCRGAEPGEIERQPQEIRPWRPYFTTAQTLVADEVRIEGPDGLLEHVALGHDPAAYVYTTETTPDGLLQIVELRPGVSSASEPIRVQVDSLDMRALRRVVVLERVGTPPLAIEAEGNVWWARTDGSGELRRPRLVLPRDLPVELREASAPTSSGER